MPLAPLLQRERMWRALRSSEARREVLEYCEALAAVLWQETPWDLPLNDWDAVESRIPVGPEVCVAWQSSDIAESFATDVIRVVSRSGCRVVSLGAIHRPAMEFAVDHLDCSAGIWVEGGGSPAGIGFRVTGPKSLGWSEAGRLRSIATAKEVGAGRPCRTAGATKSFDILPAYRESLVRHFVSEGLDLAVGGWSAGLESMWSGLQPRIGCRLQEACRENRCDEVPSATLLRTLQEEIVRQRFGGGVVFGGDGRQVWFVDRREGVLPDRVVAERLAKELRSEAGEKEIRVVASEELMWTELNVAAARLVTCRASEESLVETMQRSRAALGCDGTGRYWIAKPAPRCDGLLTLAFLARTIGANDSALRRVS
jgi:phosphomannomutase